MTARPLFSIVTVCYQSAGSIERTLRSVLAQQWTDYEYLIIDGASTDATVDIIRRLAPEFEGRLRWWSEPDKDIYDAFNKGIKQSRGSYIWLVNSDDYLESDALTVLAPVAAAHCGERTIIEGVARLEQPDGSYRLSPLSTDATRHAFYRRRLLGITHPASVFSREVYASVGLYDDRYFILGDKDLFVRCMEQGVGFVTLPRPLTTMSYGGISTRLHHRKWLADQWLASRKFGRGRLGAMLLFGRIFAMYLGRRARGLCAKLGLTGRRHRSRT